MTMPKRVRASGTNSSTRSRSSKPMAPRPLTCSQIMVLVSSWRREFGLRPQQCGALDRIANRSVSAQIELADITAHLEHSTAAGRVLDKSVRHRQDETGLSMEAFSNAMREAREFDEAEVEKVTDEDEKKKIKRKLLKVGLAQGTSVRVFTTEETDELYELFSAWLDDHESQLTRQDRRKIVRKCRRIVVEMILMFNDRESVEAFGEDKKHLKALLLDVIQQREVQAEEKVTAKAAAKEATAAATEEVVVVSETPAESEASPAS
jgi:hypothetical protein